MRLTRHTACKELSTGLAQSQHSASDSTVMIIFRGSWSREETLGRNNEPPQGDVAGPKPRLGPSFYAQTPYNTLYLIFASPASFSHPPLPLPFFVPSISSLSAATCSVMLEALGAKDLADTSPPLPCDCGPRASLPNCFDIH